MSMRIFLQALVLLTFISCNKIGVSETEAKAIKKVLAFYGGRANYSIGFDTRNGSNVNFFELKINESPLLNNDREWITIHAGNIAYLFYSNLNEEKKSKYNQIRVSVDLTNGESRSYKFSESELKEIEELYPEIEKTSKYIKYGDYTSLMNQFSKKVDIEEKELEGFFGEIISKYGMITDIQMHGFTFFEEEGYGDCVEIVQFIALKEKSGPIILVYSRETNELIGLHLP